jgi:hypothetical protein
MVSPISEWRRISAHSSSFNAAAFCNTSARSPILPMSCTSPIK